MVFVAGVAAGEGLRGPQEAGGAWGSTCVPRLCASAVGMLQEALLEVRKMEARVVRKKRLWRQERSTRQSLTPIRSICSRTKATKMAGAALTAIPTGLLRARAMAC